MFNQMEAIINSMTPKLERERPGADQRLAQETYRHAGSGTQVQDVNRLLKQFTADAEDDEERCRRVA